MADIVSAWIDCQREITDGMPVLDQLAHLHANVRAVIRYEQQALDDSWQLPHETLGKFAGNCNDMAGLWYFTLGHLLPLDDWQDGVRMIQVRLHGLPRGRDGHMVCGVVIDGETWVLDNRAAAIYRLADENRQQTLVAQSSASHFRMGRDIVPVKYDRFDAYLLALSEYPNSEHFAPELGG